NRMRPLHILVRRYGWTGAFLAAATPIPDDIVYVPLGLAKYNPWKFATATFAGKIVLNEAIVWGSIFLGKPFVDSVLEDTTDPAMLIIVAVASIAALGLVIYFSLRIDWAKIIGRWFPWAIEDSSSDDKKDNDTRAT